MTTTDRLSLSSGAVVFTVALLLTTFALRGINGAVSLISRGDKCKDVKVQFATDAAV